MIHDICENDNVNLSSGIEEQRDESTLIGVVCVYKIGTTCSLNVCWSMLPYDGMT